MGKFRGLDLEEGWINRRLADLQRQINELSSARRLGLVSDIRQVNLDPAVLTGAFTDFVLTSVTPPAGYNTAIVQMVATAGCTPAGGGGGSVGVQPKAGPINGVGQSNGRDSTGAGGGLAVTGSLAAKFAVTPGVPFTLRVAAYANIPYTVNTGNVRFSATILYTRE